jgi:hypothetical protein
MAALRAIENTHVENLDWNRNDPSRTNMRMNVSWATSSARASSPSR